MNYSISQLTNKILLLNNIETFKEFLIEFFLISISVIHFYTKKLLFDYQIRGSIHLCFNGLVEMETGGGKSLTSIIPILYFAFKKKHIHVMSSNEYLVERDFFAFKKIFDTFRLKSLLLLSLQDNYNVIVTDYNVVYTVASTIIYYYLFNMEKFYRDERRKRMFFQCAFIDEIDSVLIDKQKIPFVISGSKLIDKKVANIYKLVYEYSLFLKEDKDVIVDYFSSKIIILNHAIDEFCLFLNVDEHYQDFYVTALYFALQARLLFIRDKNYVIVRQQSQRSAFILTPINRDSGRINKSVRFNSLLQIMLEIKEKIYTFKNSLMHDRMNIANFFFMYASLLGMSATIREVSEELQLKYNKNYTTINTHYANKKTFRQRFMYTKNQKYLLILSIIRRIVSKKKRPCLLICYDMKEAYYVYNLLKKNIHKTFYAQLQYLDAKSLQKETYIFDNAGNAGYVTITTRIASRGVDIKFGFDIKNMADSLIFTQEILQKQHDKIVNKIRKNGGMLLIKTEKLLNDRLDRQVIGRTGRQGEPGEVLELFSLNDNYLTKLTAWEKNLLTISFITLCKYSSPTDVEYNFFSRLYKKINRLYDMKDFFIRQKSLQSEDLMLTFKMIYLRIISILRDRQFDKFYEFMHMYFSYMLNHNVVSYSKIYGIFSKYVGKRISINEYLKTYKKYCHNSDINVELLWSKCIVFFQLYSGISYKYINFTHKAETINFDNTNRVFFLLMFKYVVCRVKIK